MSEKIALLEDINPTASTVFEDAGFEVVTFPKSISPAEMASMAANVRAIGIRSGPNIGAEAITGSAMLEAIGCFCVEPNVDLDEANKAGVAVFNSVHENTRSVAEYVIGATFALMRRIPEHSAKMHEGTWTKTDKKSHELLGKTIGIIGHGSIGSQVAVLAAPLGMNVIYFDPASKFPPYGTSERVATIDDLYAQADIITLHVPGGEGTKNMINADSIAKMKDGAYIINAARGSVLNEGDVKKALKKGKLAGVALDVFNNEPTKRGDPFVHALQGVDGVVFSPHIGGSTIEAQSNIGRVVAEKLVGYLATGSTAGSVNMPELSLGEVETCTSRILNIHEDVPGVVADLGALIATNGLNLIGTMQRANGKIGYVAFDVDGKVEPEFSDMITNYPRSIRTRIL